jgi:Tfp pilus assembly protein PilP
MEIKLSGINLRELAKLDLSSLAELFGELPGGKKVVAISVICFFIIILLMGALYIGGGDDRKRQEVLAAFEQMAKGRATGKVNVIASSISTSIGDAGIGFGIAVKYFSAENPGYAAVVENIAIQGEEALVSYKRMETVSGKRKITDVLNEKWKKEGGKWVLAALSEVDRQILKSPGGKIKTASQRGKSGIRQSGLPAGNVAPVESAVARLTNPVAAVKDDYPPYISAGKRDPFKSLVAGFSRDMETAASGPLKMCDSNRKKEFLESFDLMSVNLVGIVGGEEKLALIETPNGNGYTVKKGMHIGRNCGKITEIRSDRIFIDEQYPDRKAGIKIVKRELKLRQDEE